MTAALPTRQIAELLLTRAYEDLPEDVTERAKLVILDSLGCALYGLNEPLTKIAAIELLDRELVPADLLPGGMADAHPTTAAGLRSMIGHAVDFDDSLITVSVHAGSITTASIFSHVANQPISGREALLALACGYDAAHRVGKLLTPEHSDWGLHCTGTLGVFAAATTTAKLLGLKREGFQTALGLAATQAAGLKCSFGTMAKPFNSGHAASSGVLAARLAARGFSASQQPLEDERGFLVNLRGQSADKWAIADENTHALRHSAIKLFAACHEIHPTVYALQVLQEKHDLSPERITSVELEVSADASRIANVGEPKSALEAKFSFSHVAACALAGYEMTTGAPYSDDAVSSPQVVALREKVRVRALPQMGKACTNLSIELTSGKKNQTGV